MDCSWVLPLSLGSGWQIIKNDMRQAVPLELRYRYRERKKKFSFQEFTLFLGIERFAEASEVGYQITVCIKLCDQCLYPMEHAQCTELSAAVEKLHRFAAQYVNPCCWKTEQLAWIIPIWERERAARGVKQMRSCREMGCLHESNRFLPVKVPAGWHILLESFYANDVYKAPPKQPHAALQFVWERDISVYQRESLDGFIYYVELQEYSNFDTRIALLCVEVYRDSKDKTILFERLDRVFCESSGEAQKRLGEMLWRYQEAGE
ncbi:MAG: hypothetical protein HFG20_02720 [Anaerotruncus sp.]|jgi:hypothetical protein|nr:hypothetical protein [Anaerotruncus sp.]